MLIETVRYRPPCGSNEVRVVGACPVCIAFNTSTKRCVGMTGASSSALTIVEASAASPSMATKGCA
jgi:hypothetical protein